MFRQLIVLLALVLLSFSSAVAAVDVNSPAPEFMLLDASGQEVSLESFKGKVVVLEWFNQDCPFVKKHYRNGDMSKLQEALTKKGVVWLTINSTNPEHRSFVPPEKRPQLLKDFGVKSTSYLSDADGKVGRAYGAITTPQMYIIDEEGLLKYKGAIDNDPDSFGDPQEAKNFVKLGVEELMSGKPLSDSSTKPYGCSVKYQE